MVLTHKIFFYEVGFVWGYGVGGEVKWVNSIELNNLGGDELEISLRHPSFGDKWKNGWE